MEKQRGQLKRLHPNGSKARRIRRRLEKWDALHAPAVVAVVEEPSSTPKKTSRKKRSAKSS